MYINCNIKTCSLSHIYIYIFIYAGQKQQASTQTDVLVSQVSVLLMLLRKQLQSHTTAKQTPRYHTIGYNNPIIICSWHMKQNKHKNRPSEGNR